MRKKVIALLLMGAMAISLFGCGTKSKSKDLVETIVQVQEASAKAKNMDITSTLLMDMESQGQAVSMKMDMGIVLFTDPMKMKIESSTDMGLLGKMDADIYMLKENEEYWSYTNMAGAWTKQKMDAALFETSMKGYNSDAYLETIKKCYSNFKETKNGDESTYQGQITGEDMNSVLKESGVLNQLGSSEVDETTLKDLEGIDITMVINNKDLVLKSMSIDMTKAMQGIMKAATQDESGKLNKCTMDMAYTLDNAADFTLPEEAKSAQEVTAE